MLFVYALCINMSVCARLKFMENMQRRHFEQNVTFCPIYVLKQRKTVAFSACSGTRRINIKEQEITQNFKSNAAVPFSFPSVGRIAAS